MTLRRFALVGGLAISANAFAQLPPAPTEDTVPAIPKIEVPVPTPEDVPANPVIERPAENPPVKRSFQLDRNPPILEATTSKPVVVQVQSAEAPMQGAPAFAKTLAESKAAYAKVRDYIGHMQRQERVNGTLQPEHTAEIRVRTDPFSIDLKVVTPKAVSGWETAYVAGRKTEFIRFRAAGALNMQSMKLDDPKALAGTRHSIVNVGLAAVLARAEKMVETEKKLRNPVQVVVAEYKFENKPCLRFEIFCEKPHGQRYAHRAVLYIDKETKLPVRWEAYDGPKPGDPSGELLESISFVNMKFNVGLGESTFDK